MRYEDPALLNDANYARLCCLLYEYGAHFSGWDWCGETEGVVWAHLRIADQTVIVLRGSVTRQDWLRDFYSIANPTDHGALGPVHPGFNLGMDAVLMQILRDGWLFHPSAPPASGIVVVGHSLGAAHATLLTGLISARFPNTKVDRCVFGEPRSGFQQLANLVNRYPGRSYRNGGTLIHDLVTDVPLSIPGVQHYVHANPFSLLREIPKVAAIAKLGPLAYHHMPLYEAGVVERFKGDPTIPRPLMASPIHFVYPTDELDDPSPALAKVA